MSDGSDTTEDLEQRVAELEATVRGLTEELVDATERLRELEREAGMHETTSEKRARREQTDVTPEATQDEVAAESPEGDTAKKADAEDSTDSEESSSDDIIVA